VLWPNFIRNRGRQAIQASQWHSRPCGARRMISLTIRSEIFYLLQEKNNASMSKIELHASNYAFPTK